MIGSGIHLMDCDIGMSLIEDNTVDVIMTDPPYVKEQWEEAYNILARHAPRVLKPSGFMISYCPSLRLNKIMDIFEATELKWFWLIAQINTGATTLIWSRYCIAGFKPIIIYQKPPMKPCRKGFSDVINRGKREKQHHEWQQAIDESLYVLSRFCQAGDIVLDPYLGSGTTALASQLLGLNCIGFEIEEKSYKEALYRLEQKPLDLCSYGMEYL